MAFAIGIYQTKNTLNVGCLMRSAYNFGASMVFTIGKRYKYENSDTVKAFKHIPLIHFDNYEDFIKHMPMDWVPVGIELDNKSEMLMDFKHPKQAVYILGAEDTGLPLETMKLKNLVKVPTKFSINVAVMGTIVMYDRILKDSK